MPGVYGFGDGEARRILRAVLRSEQSPWNERERKRGRTDRPTAFYIGVLDGALSYQGSATMSVWAWNGSADADTGVNVTVYDWLLTSGQTIASGKRIVCVFAGGRMRVIGASCA